ncbi:MAG: protein kinase [Acidobacteriota bacterium]
MPLVPGSQIGPYEIIELIGKGGMGEVYRAHDPRLRRDVAIKTSAQRFGERFEREARAVAALNHPNICQVYDVGPDYLVMELIEGPTLAERIHEGTIPLDEALRISEQIAEALAAAHEKLITHRDLKPGNVKIKEDGTVKVLDFGLAKIGGTPTTEVSTESPTLSMTLTQAGVILGTAAYMSPEQARGKPVDARSDVWAFGVVFYEMLTARRLFKGEDLGETLASVVKEAPDLSGIPPKVRRLLEACLQKDPRKRLQAIGDRHLLLTEQAAPPPQRTQWLWPALAVASLLGAAWLGWTHFRETPQVQQSMRFQMELENLSVRYFQISPDGRNVVFVARANSGVHLRVRDLDALEARDLPGTDGAVFPFWSPDSAHIGFFAQGKLKQIALTGGPAINIADAPDARGGAWGPDGTIVFAPIVNGALYSVAAGGGTPTLLKLPRTGDRASLRFPKFVPGTDRFMYVYLAEKPEDAGAYTATLSGSPAVRLLSEPQTPYYVPPASPSTAGQLLFLRDNTLMAQPFDIAALKSTGDALPLAENVPVSGTEGDPAFTVSRNGVLLYSAGSILTERKLVWIDRAGKRSEPVLTQKGFGTSSLSPKGTQIMYSQGPRQGQTDLWLYDVARNASQQFTFGPLGASEPTWSPGGDAVVFTVRASGRPTFDLYRKETQSAAKEELLFKAGTNAFASDWSADGKFLVFSQTGDATKDDIWLLPLAAGDRKPQLFKQTPYADAGGTLSPDGRWMAYSSDASGKPEIFIEPRTPGGAVRQISIGGGVSPRWRSDGRELYFVSDRKLMAVDVKPGPDLTWGAPHELFSAQDMAVNARFAAYQPSADGSRFLASVTAGDRASAQSVTVLTNWQSGLAK